MIWADAFLSGNAFGRTPTAFGTSSRSTSFMMSSNRPFGPAISSPFVRGWAMTYTFWVADGAPASAASAFPPVTCRAAAGTTFPESPTWTFENTVFSVPARVLQSACLQT
jgi:hypothetical protein